jgi:hypothetical protein
MSKFKVIDTVLSCPYCMWPYEGKQVCCGEHDGHGIELNVVKLENGDIENLTNEELAELEKGSQ